MLQYRCARVFQCKEVIVSIPIHLLEALSQEISRIPADPSDLGVAASLLTAQVDALARLDELELMTVEPATVLLPPQEAIDVL